MGRFSRDLDLEMQAPVVGGDDRIGKARRNRIVRLRQSRFEQPFRADGAAALFVIGEMKLDGARQRLPQGFERKQRVGICCEIGFRDRHAAAIHSAVLDHRAVGIPCPPVAGGHGIAVRIQCNRRPLSEAPPYDQIGHADGAVGAARRIRNRVAFDAETQRFQKLGGSGRVLRAVTRRIVRRQLDELGQKPDLFVAMRAQVTMDLAMSAGRIGHGSTAGAD